MKHHCLLWNSANSNVFHRHKLCSQSHIVEPHSYWAVPFFLTYRTRPPTFITDCDKVEGNQTVLADMHTHTWQTFYSHARMQNKAFTVLLFMTWYVDVHVNSCLAFPLLLLKICTRHIMTHGWNMSRVHYTCSNNHLLSGPWMTTRMTSLMNLLSGNINYKQVHMQ